MVFAVRDLMKDAYPELIETADRVAETIKGEETRFAHTLDVGTEAAWRILLRCYWMQSIAQQLRMKPIFED